MFHCEAKNNVAVVQMAITLILAFLVIQTSAIRHRSARSNSVSQVDIEVINATSVTLRWTTSPLPTSSGQPCPVQKYAIRLRQQGVRKSRGWKLEPDRRSVSLHDLQPRTEYQLRLTTFTCDGHRRHSRWTRIYTEVTQSSLRHHQSRDTSQHDDDSNEIREETQAPGQPTAVRTDTTSDSATVSWLAPDDNTLVRSYMIGYGEGVPDVKWIYVNGSQRNVTIQQLKPSTQYVVSVRAINRFGKGLVVYDLVYTRDDTSNRQEQGNARTGLPAPSSLQSRVISSQSIRLQWIDSSLNDFQRITDERYYNVYYNAVPDGKNLSVIVKALHVTLHDLEPGKRYRFKVRTVKGIETSPFSDDITDRTPTSPDTSEDADNYSDAIHTSSVHRRRDDHQYLYGDRDASSGSSRSHGISSDQGKTKRAHNQPPLGAQAQLAYDHQLPAAETGNVTSQGDASSASSNQVAFRSLVQHRVSAYVTWPAELACDVDSLSGSQSVAGYIFRYRAIGENGGYVLRNLVDNFILLDNLVPGVQYRYQVRYVPERGEASAWSQEGQLDTTPPIQQQADTPVTP